MNQDEHPLRPGLAPSPPVGVPPAEIVGQEGFMRAGEALALEARGRRRRPADNAARKGNPGGSAASDGGATGIGTSRAPCGASRPGAEPSSPTVAGNGEATFTAPTQSGEYDFYCTYHPSMNGTLIVR
jgi:hypothetical protein